MKRMRATDCLYCKIKLDFTSAPILDIPAKMRDEFASIESRIYPGMRIALALGSRGISNLPFITKTLIELLKEKGTVPFIIPAMGSHGGLSDWKHRWHVSRSGLYG